MAPPEPPEVEIGVPEGQGADAPAIEMRESALPADLSIGARGVAALQIALRHPGVIGAAPIRVDSLLITCHDAARRLHQCTQQVENRFAKPRGHALLEFDNLTGAQNHSFGRR